jgi:FMN-dependent NADH-azoreductase
VSRRLTRHYVDEWKAQNPAGRVIERDLAADPPPFVSHAWIEASRTPADKITPEQAEILALSDALIDEVVAADEIVLGVPMHNFSIPAALKAWIDMLARAGKTFTYGASGPKGLIPAKKVVAVVSQGGTYGDGSPFDFQVPYLLKVLAFLGLTNITVVHADRQGMGADAAEKSVANALQQLSTATATYAG